MHAATASGPVAVHAVVPLPEVPLRVRLAALHAALPHLRPQPADATVLLSASALRRPENVVVTYVAL